MWGGCDHSLLRILLLQSGWPCLSSSNHHGQVLHTEVRPHTIHHMPWTSYYSSYSINLQVTTIPCPFPLLSRLCASWRRKTPHCDYDLYTTILSSGKYQLSFSPTIMTVCQINLFLGCSTSQQHAKGTSGKNLLGRFYMLPHWNRSCRSNLPSHLVSLVTMDQLVPAWTLWNKMSDRVVTRVPVWGGGKQSLISLTQDHTPCL